jgi:CRISPR-associated protein Csb3
MSDAATPIVVNVDPCNPGQFFACCGLLELADRLWPGADGCFSDDGRTFRITTTDKDATLEQLLQAVLAAPLQQLEKENCGTSPLFLADRFQLRLDWWNDTEAGGSDFKTWAGRMEVVTIARAMHKAIARAIPLGPNVFQLAEVIPDADNPRKSVAPFQLDSTRGGAAQNLDIGFSPDVQGIDVTSSPSVEFLCLIGLQRFRPVRKPDAREYHYTAWTTPLPPQAASAAACGFAAGRRYEFRMLFRTKYLKGFLPATPIGDAP